MEQSDSSVEDSSRVLVLRQRNDEQQCLLQMIWNIDFLLLFNPISSACLCLDLLCDILLKFLCPAPSVGALSDDALLTSVCTAYIGPKSRTERPRKTKIGTEVTHLPVAQPTLSKHWRENITRLAYPKLTWGSSNFCLWPLIAPGYLGGWLPGLSSALWCRYPIPKYFVTSI